MVQKAPKGSVRRVAPDAIPLEQWELYRPVIRQAQQANLPFALGGGFAFSCYSGLWRNTKDIDLFMLERDRAAFITLLDEAGFVDYFEQLAYDRSWIYRSYRGGVIIDLIWEMANHRTKMDRRWVEEGELLELHGLKVRAIPLEELLWAKLYIIQRERCDWPDLLNLLEARGATVDWEHLLKRLGQDERLLAGLLTTFSWLSPAGAARLPQWLWPRLGLALQPVADPQAKLRHARLVDSRPWLLGAGKEST